MSKENKNKKNKNKEKESQKKFSISIILGIILVLATIIILFVAFSGKSDKADVSASQNSLEDSIISNTAGKVYFEDTDKEYEFEELTSGFAYTDNPDYFSYAFDGEEFLDRFITSTDKISKIEQDLNISLEEAKNVDFNNYFVYILWNTAITDECSIKKISHIGIMNEMDEESEVEKEKLAVIYKDSEEKKTLDETKGEFLVSYDLIKLSKEYLPEKEMDFKVVPEE